MKRLPYLIASLAVIFSGCVSELIDPSGNDHNTRGLVFSASHDSDETATRTQMDAEQKHILWSVGDKIEVFDSDEMGYEFTTNTAGSSASFTLTDDDSPSDTELWYALYPYDEDADLTDGVFTTTLKDEFTETRTGSFDDNMNIAVAKSSSMSLSFKNVLSWLKVASAGLGDDVVKIEMRGNNDEILAGQIEIDYTGTTPVATLAGGTGSKVITLNVVNYVQSVNTPKEDRVFFYIPVIPQTFENGFNLKFYNSAGESGSFNLASSVTFKRNESRGMFAGIVPDANEIRYTSYRNVKVEYTVDGVSGNVVTENIAPSANDGVGIIRFSEPLTTIDASAFENESDLVSVTLPSDVETIGAKAFKYCTRLKDIDFGTNLTSIGERAFFGCNDLIDPAFPETLVSIGDEAFAVCSSLNQITLPASLTEIGAGVFTSSCSIESFSGAFAYDSRHLIDGDRLVAFAMGGLEDGTHEVIPATVHFVDKGAYQGATALTAITLPAELTEIGSSAFAQCFKLKSITIPASVAKIHDFAFEECEALDWIKIKRKTSVIQAVPNDSGDFGAFSTTEECPIYVPSNTINWYNYGQYWDEYGINNENGPSRYRVSPSDSEIFYTTTDGQPASYTEPSGYQIAHILPADNNGIGVLSLLSGDAWEAIPRSLFESCTNLKTVTLPDKVETIGIRSFLFCKNLESVVFGENVRVIAEQAFYDCGLTTLELPESLFFIGAYAFSLNEFTSVRLPAGVTNIGINPFSRCGNLQYFTGDNSYIYDTDSETSHLLVRPDGELITFAAAAFDPEESCMMYPIPTIGEDAFSGVICEGIILPEEVTNIHRNAFQFCPNLKWIKVLSLTPNITLANGAFDNINSLDEYDLLIPGAGYKAYQEDAGWSNYASHFKPYQTAREVWYTTVSGNLIPTTSSFTPPFGILLDNFKLNDEICTLVYNAEIGALPNAMFDRNTDLKSVSLPTYINTIGEMAFNGCSNLEEVTFNPYLEVIENYAFNQCKLSSVDLPYNLKKIGKHAFRENHPLTNARVPGSITTLGTNPFVGCENLDVFNGTNSLISSDKHCLILNGRLVSYTPDGCYEGYTVPEGVTEIGEDAMQYSTFTGLTLPSTLVKIGRAAVFACPDLAEVNIPASVTSIGSYGFAYCENMEKVVMEGNTPPTLGDEVFVTNSDGIFPPYGKILIPGAGLSNYWDAPGWSDYHSFFQPY